MVGAGEPEGAAPLHPPPADEDILEGLVQGVAHVQLTGDVGGRDDDGVGFLFRVYLGVEEVPLLPEGVGAVLHRTGVVDLCKLSCHFL